MKAKNATPIQPWTASTRARKPGGRLVPKIDTMAPNKARISTQSTIEPS
jgi:hypothetical protein